MTARDADARLTFDDAAWAWLTNQGPGAIAAFLDGAHWLMEELDTRIHVWSEQGYDAADLRISMRLLDLSKKGS
jgi:hypothetical protein